jgi:predicted transcriptional regulator
MARHNWWLYLAVTSDLLKRLRLEAGLTQKRLAELVGISQAHIAKIEQGKVDPRLSTVNRVLKVLNQRKKKKCMDIMSRGVICTKPGDKILDVSENMVRHGISQIPVIVGGRVVGTVTEESIMRRLGSGIVDETAEKVMVAALPIVDEEAEVESIRGLLKTRQGVLVAKGKKVVGIITRSDLLKVICEPI